MRAPANPTTSPPLASKKLDTVVSMGEGAGMTKEQAQSWLRRYGWSFRLDQDDNGFAYAVTYPTGERKVTGYTRVKA